jgi:hypothetical protein
MQTNLVNIDEVQVNTYSVRRYGNTFFSYAEIKYGNTFIDCGDPFPSSKFPRYEGVLSLLLHLSNSSQVTVEERKFRQLFKGIKSGAKIYADKAEFLESKNIELI